MIEIKAHAKLNLYLDITGTRLDKYHELETVMQQIDLADDIKLDISENESISVITVKCNSGLPTDERNIAYRACKVFLSELKPEKFYNVNIDINKKIPVEAGMGGSSTDGAAVLTALNEYFGFPYDTEALCKIGSWLGADVPFCIKGGTCICTGTGDEIVEIAAVRDCVFLIIKPEFSFNTAEAYKQYDDNPLLQNVDFKEFTNYIRGGRFIEGARLMYNIFEEIYSDYRISAIKDKLIKYGAVGASMTGSGSAVFGVFRDEQKAKEAGRHFKDSQILIARPIKVLEK